MADNIQATPRNYLGGLLTDAYKYMQSPERTQQMQGFAGLLGTTGLPQTIERMAYSEPLTNMSRANVPLLKSETADALMTVAPMVGPAARGANAGLLFAGRAGERLAERVVPQVMERGGLPAQLLGDLAQGSRSQMYIGAESPMYNKEAAFKASQMLKKGATPQEVWQQTGTGKYGNDFVQEISDAGASISQGKLPTKYIKNYGDVPAWKLGQALEHPELYKAYPDLAGVESSFRSGSSDYASYSPALDWISYSKDAYQKGFISKANKDKIELAKKNFDEFHNSPEYIAYDEKLNAALDEGKDITGLLDSNLEKKQKAVSDAYIGQRAKLLESTDQGSTLGLGQSAKSTTLHEVQHAIQEREGWAKGGNPDDFARNLIRQRDALNSRIEDLNQQMRGAVGTPAYEDLMSQRMKAVNELLGKKLNDPVDLLEQAQKQYESLAGEAQARSTQTRMNLTPEERLQYYPFEQQSPTNKYGLDINPSELVFRGGLLD
jgi:hypothetical protein